MGRELKFRVFDMVDYMSKPFTFDDLKEGEVAFVSGLPIMQFTGLHDKNGKEIYEGDIVAFSTDTHFSKGVVTYLDNGFYIDTTSDEKYLPDICEIIGNIHQNPELIP